jgi:hypothetical protein
VRYDGSDEGPYEDEVRASLECMQPYKTCMSQHVSSTSGKTSPIVLPLQGTLCFLTSSVVMFSLIHLQRIFRPCATTISPATQEGQIQCRPSTHPPWVYRV